VRFNVSQPLCRCHGDPCSASFDDRDKHSIDLKMKAQEKTLTLAKTCEKTSDVRDCKNARDWSILAMQNIRTGKAHYLVLCQCPTPGYLDGPLDHDQPKYANIPGIRVYGMVCVQSRKSRKSRSTITPPLFTEFGGSSEGYRRYGGWTLSR